MTRLLLLILLALPMMTLEAQASTQPQCFRLSQKKSFSAHDRQLPLLCIKNQKTRFRDSKMRFITVERKIGRSGVGVGEYVAHIKSNPKCRGCNKTSYKLMNVPYESPYL